MGFVASKFDWMWPNQPAPQVRLLGTWLFLVLGLASVAHLLTGGLDLMQPFRPWLSAAYGWWIALVFCYLQIGIGRRLVSALRDRETPVDSAGTGLSAFAAGFWLTSCVAMLLAALGQLNNASVLLYLIAGAVVSLASRGLGWQGLRRSSTLGSEGFSAVILAFVILITAVALPYLLQTLIPNSDWDGASTHLPLAKWFLDRGLQPIPLEYGNLVIPGTVHLVYAMFLAIGAEPAILPLNFVISLMVCAAAGSIARHFWGATAGWWALAVALSTNLILELGLDPRIDGFLALFCTVAAHALMRWILEGREPRWLVVASMALGCALGTKATAIFPLALWAIPALWAGVRDRQSPGKSKLRVALLALGFLLVPSGTWYVVSTFSFGDPLYPRLRGELMESADGTLVSLADAVDELLEDDRWEEKSQRVLSDTRARQAEFESPASLLDLLSVYLEPGRHSRKPGHTLSPLLLLFVFLPVSRKDRASWLLVWMALSVYVVIGLQTYLVRYGLVFYPLMAAGSGAVLAGVAHWWWRLGWVGLLTAQLVANVSLEWRQVERQRVAAWLSGMESRVEWLSQVGYNTSTEMPEMVGEILARQEDGSLSEDGEILMLGEAKFNLLDFRFLPDISRTGNPWLAYLARNDGDLDAVHRELHADGIRYLLVNLGYFGWVRGNTSIDVDEYAISMATLREFVEERGQVVISTPGVVLFRLTPPP